jgi:hypothetical protein
VAAAFERLPGARFSAETDHHASAKRFSDAPLFAYRMTDAVGRPYAATASGQDWAFIKESSLHGLVRGWIALSYAAGHCLMAPHRQWCHTQEKGTHWYEGPAERLAPVYQFVRRNAAWLDGFENHAELGLLVPHRAFVANPGRWFQISQGDDVRPLNRVVVHIDLAALKVPGAARARLVAPDADPIELGIDQGRVGIPALGLWAMLVVERTP